MAEQLALRGLDGFATDVALPLARAIGDGGASLFNECGARGLDGHAGQHGSGAVFDEAGDRRLREERSGNEKGENKKTEQFDGKTQCDLL